MTNPDERRDAAALDAWRQFCRRLEAVGEEALPGVTAADPADAVAAIEHIAGQVLCWTGWSVFHADPRRPRFQRQNDLITPWGGPNADNVYLHARVDAARTYRIRGRMHACEEFLLAVRAGFMHQPKWGTLFQVAASDLGIGRGDEFELRVGGDDPGTGGWIPLPDDATMVSFREYYFDWRADEPAMMTIECLDVDADDPGGRLDAATLAARLEDTAAGLGHSVAYWHGYLRDHRAAGRDNTFAPPLKFAKGLAVARYGECYWDLGDDEVLLVETDVPVARYWGFQCYDTTTFDLIDPIDRRATLNHEQIAVDPDGRVRLVVAATDPGVANWLDSGGRRAGLLTFRWFWSEGDPTPSTRVLPRSALRAAMPADTVLVDPEARRADQAARRAHLGWRFRT
ncbi:MAG: DUF1214 domain-containing protein [Actinomycetota bacterium]